jgi:molecular chaperone Hsp33
MLDQCQRFYLEHAPVRGAWVRLAATTAEMHSKHHYPPLLQASLAELAAASVLLVDSLKFDGHLLLQAQPASGSALQLVCVEASQNLLVRGMAQWDESRPLPETFAECFSKQDQGRFVLTLDPKDEGQQYQSVVALNGGSIQQMLQDYLAQSQQVPSALLLAWDGAAVTGLLIQKLPNRNDTDTDAWDRSLALFNTLTAAELSAVSAETTLFNLFHEEGVRVVEPRPVAFFCPCTEARVHKALRVMGWTEVQALLEEQDGEVSVNCEFCNKRYAFNHASLQALFNEFGDATVADTRH